MVKVLLFLFLLLYPGCSLSNGGSLKLDMPDSVFEQQDNGTVTGVVKVQNCIVPGEGTKEIKFEYKRGSVWPQIVGGFVSAAVTLLTFDW